MTPGSWRDRIPVKSQILMGICALCILILALVFLSVYPAGPVAVSHTNATVHVKILEINDFHGHMATGQTMSNRPVGVRRSLLPILNRRWRPGMRMAPSLPCPGM